MWRPSVVALLFSCVASVPSPPTQAHPGGLNAAGCHTNHKTGEYHCHRSGTPARSFLNAGGGSSSFRNCSEAREAGVAPLYRGQPGYAEHLDRDGDGIACEPYRGH